MEICSREIRVGIRRFYNLTQCGSLDLQYFVGSVSGECLQQHIVSSLQTWQH